MIDRKKIFRLYLKTVMQGGTPEYTARGVAIGLFLAFFIPGFQVVFAVALAFLLRGNKMLAAAFTFVTNPYTAPIFCPFQCWLGSVMLGDPITYSTVSLTFNEVLRTRSMGGFVVLGKEIGSEYLLPFIVGGTSLGLLCAVFGYFISLWLVVNYRGRKARRPPRQALLVMQVMKSNGNEGNLADKIVF